MLKRWDSVYPLPTGEQDWYTTYYGGLGSYTHGNGIVAYMDPRWSIRCAPPALPAGVKVYNLCGNLNNIALLHNEHTGPSDGVAVHLKLQRLQPASLIWRLGGPCGQPSRLGMEPGPPLIKSRLGSTHHEDSRCSVALVFLLAAGRAARPRTGWPTQAQDPNRMPLRRSEPTAEP